jgi:hypothetical protein
MMECSVAKLLHRDFFSELNLLPNSPSVRVRLHLFAT